MAIALLACSMSASSQTMAGSLPPSSSVTCFKSEAASDITCLPVCVSPVKPILRTLGFLISSWPTTAPGPTTTLSTPGGSPPSFISSTSRMVESGVVLAGLATTVVPTASAGANGLVGGVDRLPGFLDARLRDLVDQLARRRVSDLHGRAGTRRRRLAVNHHRAHGLGIPPDCVRN